MADLPITPRFMAGVSLHVFEHYNAAALTAAAVKKEWIVPFRCRLVDVIIDSETAGSGGTSDIADINKNGTTIYTTQANRPTLLSGDTGLWTEAAEPEVTEFAAGDVLSLDIDQIATTGSARVKVAIVVTKL